MQKFIKMQALFYINGSRGHFTDFILEKILSTNDARILNIKFCPQSEMFSKNFSEFQPVVVSFLYGGNNLYRSRWREMIMEMKYREKIPNMALLMFGEMPKSETKKFKGVFYAEEILTDEMTIPKKIFAEIEKILSDSETNLFLKSFCGLKNIFIKNICKKHNLQLVEEIPNKKIKYANKKIAAEICYENGINYPGAMFTYIFDDETEINFDVYQNLKIKISIEDNQIDGEVWQSLFDNRKDFSVRNLQEMKNALAEPSTFFNFNDRADKNKLDEGLIKLLSDSRKFDKNLSELEKLIEETL